MKIIRNGVFETNSSSSHCISYYGRNLEEIKEAEHIEPNCLVLNSNMFYQQSVNGFVDKASLLLSYLWYQQTDFNSRDVKDTEIVYTKDSLSDAIVQHNIIQALFDQFPAFEKIVFRLKADSINVKELYDTWIEDCDLQEEYDALSCIVTGKQTVS